MKAHEEGSMRMYKVVFVDNMGGLVSAMTFADAEVLYLPGEWAEAPRHLALAGYHLLVFDDLQNARDFRSDASSQIWECDCRHEITPLPEKKDYAVLSHFGITGASIDKDDPWPPGTRMFKKVKLTKRIA